MASPQLPLFFERYEIKYQIPLAWVDPICRWIEPFCEMDYYSEKSLEDGGDGFYPITNLYLDTPNFQFLKHKEAGMNQAISMRVRSYGNQPKAPYFLELKHNNSGIKKKFRTTIYDENWQDLITYDRTVEDFEGLKAIDANRDLFLRVAWQNRVEPKILTSYRRRAYASTINQYARVTFDRDLRYQHRDPWQWSLRHDRSQMTSYDHEQSFEPDCSVILELKSTVEVPTWFLDLIAAFGLEQRSFSKCGAGLMELLPFNYRQRFREPA